MDRKIRQFAIQQNTAQLLDHKTVKSLTELLYAKGTDMNSPISICVSKNPLKIYTVFAKGFRALNTDDTMCSPLQKEHIIDFQIYMPRFQCSQNSLSSSVVLTKSYIQ